MNARRIAFAAMILVVLPSACVRRSRPANSSSASAAASPAPVSYDLRLGRGVFQHYCLICHGESGTGDGFNAFNLDPKPRDLSDPAFQKKTSDADLADAIRRGGGGVGLSPLMPPWGKTLSPRQVDGVVLYIRSLRQKPGI